jgi:hypothetical protein
LGRPDWPQKIFRFRFPRTVSSFPPSRLMKRGVRVVTIRGVRDAVDAIALRARGIAGRPQALSWGCERLIRAGRAAQFAYGKSVWFWHPWLVSSWRRLFESNRVRRAVNPAATEAKGIRLRGERAISRQTIAQGKPGCLGFTCGHSPVHSCAHLPHRGPWVPAGTRSSLRPLVREGRQVIMYNSGASRRESAVLWPLSPGGIFPRLPSPLRQARKTRKRNASGERVDHQGQGLHCRHF